MTFGVWHRYGLFTAAFMLVMAGHTAGLAQSIEHKGKLGLETRLFRFVSTTVDLEGPSPEETVTNLEFGVFGHGAPLSSVAAIVGQPASSFGADLGFGITDSVLVGTRVMFDYGRLKSEDGESISGLQFAFLPHADVVFLRRQSFRPFLGAQLGAQISSASLETMDVSSTIFLVGASLGAFGFVSDAVSIDPRVSFLYSFGSAEIDVADADTDSISVALMIGLSGWV